MKILNMTGSIKFHGDVTCFWVDLDNGVGREEAVSDGLLDGHLAAAGSHEHAVLAVQPA